MLLANLCLILSIAAPKVLAACKKSKPIIIDTDIFSSVDDIGALAVANVFHNRGKVDLLGVAVNTPSKYGAVAVDVIDTYFGNGDIPIAAMRPFTNETWFDDRTFIRAEFASKVAFNFQHTSNPGDFTDPVTLYRKILGSADDGSITILSIGFFDNLSALLNSTSDEYSSYSGGELVKRKVDELVIMGGEYPSGSEYNFAGVTPLATYHVVNNWPGRMTFSGFSLGSSVVAGSSLSAHPDSPVLAAYRWYKGCNTARKSWDPVTTLYAVNGLGDLLDYAIDYGYNHVFPNGSNTWIYDKSVTNQRWIKLREDVSNVTVAEVLDEIYISSPSRKRPSCNLPDLGLDTSLITL